MRRTPKQDVLVKADAYSRARMGAYRRWTDNPGTAAENKASVDRVVAAYAALKASIDAFEASIREEYA